MKQFVSLYYKGESSIVANGWQNVPFFDTNVFPTLIVNDEKVLTRIQELKPNSGMETYIYFYDEYDNCNFLNLFCESQVFALIDKDECLRGNKPINYLQKYCDERLLNPNEAQKIQFERVPNIFTINDYINDKFTFPKRCLFDMIQTILYSNKLLVLKASGSNQEKLNSYISVLCDIIPDKDIVKRMGIVLNLFDLPDFLIEADKNLGIRIVTTSLNVQSNEYMDVIDFDRVNLNNYKEDELDAYSKLIMRLESYSLPHYLQEVIEIFSSNEGHPTKDYCDLLFNNFLVNENKINESIARDLVTSQLAVNDVYSAINLKRSIEILFGSKKSSDKELISKILNKYEYLKKDFEKVLNIQALENFIQNDGDVSEVELHIIADNMYKEIRESIDIIDTYSSKFKMNSKNLNLNIVKLLVEVYRKFDLSEKDTLIYKKLDFLLIKYFNYTKNHNSDSQMKFTNSYYEYIAQDKKYFSSLAYVYLISTFFSGLGEDRIRKNGLVDILKKEEDKYLRLGQFCSMYHKMRKYEAEKYVDDDDYEQYQKDEGKLEKMPEYVLNKIFDLDFEECFKIVKQERSIVFYDECSYLINLVAKKLENKDEIFNYFSKDENFIEISKYKDYYLNSDKYSLSEHLKNEIEVILNNIENAKEIKAKYLGFRFEFMKNFINLIPSKKKNYYENKLVEVLNISDENGVLAKQEFVNDIYEELPDEVDIRSMVVESEFSLSNTLSPFFSLGFGFIALIFIMIPYMISAGVQGIPFGKMLINNLSIYHFIYPLLVWLLTNIYTLYLRKRAQYSEKKIVIKVLFNVSLLLLLPLLLGVLVKILLYFIL